MKLGFLVISQGHPVHPSTGPGALKCPTPSQRKAFLSEIFGQERNGHLDEFSEYMVHLVQAFVLASLDGIRIRAGNLCGPGRIRIVQ